MPERIATVPWERCQADTDGGQCVLVVGHRGPHESPVATPPANAIVRVYRGRQQADAVAEFQDDADELSRDGYVPVSQSWAQGQWGPGAFLAGLALILAFGIGLIVLAYLLIVKPAGTLTVSYERRARRRDAG